MMSGFNFKNFYVSITGLLIVLFFFLGRWNLGRLSELETDKLATLATVDFENPLIVPRVWVAFAMLGMIIISLNIKNHRADNNNLYNKSQKFISRLVILFVLTYIVTSLWALSMYYAFPKIYELSTLLIAVIFTYRMFQVIPAERIMHAFWFFVVIIAGLFAFIALINLPDFISSGYMQVRVFGGGKNTFGRNVALLMLGGFYFNRQKKNVFIWLSISMVAFLLVIISGGRGAIIGAIAALMVYILSEHKKNKKKILMVLLGVVIIHVLITYTPIGEYFILNINKRIIEQTIEKGHLAERDIIWQTSYDIGMKRPLFGSGLAAYSYYTESTYPHNFILEMFIEGGLILVVFFFFILMNLLKHVIKYRQNIDPLSLAMFILIFIAHQTSGDIYDARVVFMTILLLVSPYKARINYSNLKK